MRHAIVANLALAALLGVLLEHAVSAPGAPPRKADPNWITVAPNGRYLMFEDGRPFVPLGVAMAGDHVNFDHFGQTTIAGRRYSFGEDHFGRLFADMARHGENFLRIDIEGTSLMPRPDIQRHIAEGKLQFLEDPAGTFNEEYARRIDRLVALAEEHGIYLGIVLITHTCDVTCIAQNLDLHPYHVSKGGPLEEMNDLLVDGRAKDLWLQRMRYISDRWGHSRHIAMWELYNELLNCGGHDARAAERWTAEMGTALRDYEMAAYGKAHPVIVSTVDFVPKHRFFCDSPGTDLMVSHYYGRLGWTGNPVRAALDIHRGTLQNLKRIGFSRPFLENERTLAASFPVSIQREMEHAAAWALMASGAASPGCTWARMGAWGAFRTKDVVSDTHASMRRILDELDFAHFDSRPLGISSGNPEIVAMAVGDGGSALGWVLHRNPDDYDIDAIDAWRAGEIEDPKVAFVVLLNWLRIVREHAPRETADAVADRLAGFLVDQLDLDRAKAREAAQALLDGPPGLERARETLRQAGVRGRPHQDALREALHTAHARLEAIEERLGILSAVYRGHPPVQTQLTFEGCCAGEHEVIWYDDSAGVKVHTERVRGPRFAVKTPAFRRHVAFVMRSPR